MITNPLNFDVTPEAIYIPANSSVYATLTYTPSQLDITESSEIIFESDDIGQWKFQVYGEGQAPQDFEPLTVAGSLNKDVSGHIRFKNPFKQDITVNVSMEGDERDLRAFDLLLQKTKRILLKTPEMINLQSLTKELF